LVAAAEPPRNTFASSSKISFTDWEQNTNGRNGKQKAETENPMPPRLNQMIPVQLQSAKFRPFFSLCRCEACRGNDYRECFR
jgi:hypothetical protein